MSGHRPGRSGFPAGLRNILHRCRLAFVLAPEGFREEEYEDPACALRTAGAEIVVASLRRGECAGMSGRKVAAAATLEEISAGAAGYAGVVFVGGYGAEVFWDSARALQVAREFFQAGRVTAGICYGSVVLARAGLLAGRRATTWEDVSFELRRAGAIYRARPVEVDGNLITASGPAAAEAFGLAIAEALAVRPVCPA